MKLNSMKNRFYLVIVVAGISLGIFIPGCNQTRQWILNVSFQLNELEDYPRSDQLVI